MTRSPAARIAAVLALLIPIVAIAAFFLVRSRDDSAEKSRAAVTAFAAAWSRGDDDAAATLTDGRAAAQALKANRAGLDGAKVSARAAAPLTVKDGRATGHLKIYWRVPSFGYFAYTAPVTAIKTKDDRWLVHFDPRTIHPRLTAGTRLGTSVDRPQRAGIVDRDGRPLVQERAVVRVGLQRDKVTDIEESANALATALDVDAKALTTALKGAGPKQFVEAQTLREADYDAIEADLEGIPGLLAVDGTAPLAPTRAFARALLGGVGPVTAEQLKKYNVSPGQEIGQWGLQQAYNPQLAGYPEISVLIRDSKTGDSVHTLKTLPAKPPRTLRTTLDRDVQQAAEQALNGIDQNAALVAVQPSTGDILAVANRPVDDTFNRGMLGTYAPGSTFKVITTAALLREGVKPSDTVECPKTLVIDGKTFKNFEGEEAGAATFADDFAISCNTAFVSLSSKLRASALGKVAKDYGVGRKYTLTVGAAPSQVPAGTDKVSRAAAMIGQDRITASPLAMAGVAATVADGRWHRPRVVSTDRKQAGPEIAAGELATLRDLMRQVVTRGTAATAFAGVGGEIAGKTGTAEFGEEDPPETHAWFIAYRGDVAIAVLVEQGRSGGSVAAPLAAKFFTDLVGD